MYTEILKIIEGGLSKDTQKVYNYSQKLASRLQEDGDNRMSRMISNKLEQNYTTLMSLDELRSTPVDQESRLSIVDVYTPLGNEPKPVLSDLLEKKVGEFVDFIQHKDELQKNGIPISNTLLLYGEPGCGKTTIAKYIADQTHLPLLIARFDALVSSLLGSTSKNIRKLFDFADKKPCILFLDEFDAIAKARDDQHEIGELKRVINSLLQNIDLFSKDSILIAATNHASLLDKAVWRRFNTVLEVGKPHEKELERLIRQFIGSFQTSFLQDPKKMQVLTGVLDGMTPSAIETVIINVKAHLVIHNSYCMDVEDILIHLFEERSNHDTSIEQLVEFLSKNGITQNQISNKLNISLRQVKNYQKKED